MRRIAAIVLATAISLTGCASTGFLGFLATTGYVDAKTKKLQDEQAAEIKKMQAQLDEINALKQQMQSSLSTLPREVLKQLNEAINAYLQNK